MLNVILPIFGTPDHHPLCLETVGDRPIIAWSLQHIEALSIPKRYFVISTDAFICKHHLDKILPMFTQSDMHMVRLKNNTQGMPCSILMASDRFDLNEPFLVSSVDQYINTDLQTHLNAFMAQQVDAGCIGFDSIHPKWSYAEVNENGLVERVAEKVPISRHALTSSYYYKSGQQMCEAIETHLMRGDTVRGKFYLAPCFNEMILAGQHVAYRSIASEHYFNFYDQETIAAFRNYIQKQSDSMVDLTQRYAQYFDQKNLDGITGMLAGNIALMDSFTPTITGLEPVIAFYKHLFATAQSMHFSVQHIAQISNQKTMIQFRFTCNDDAFEGVDILTFEGTKIVALDAYLHKVEPA